MDFEGWTLGVARARARTLEPDTGRVQARKLHRWRQRRSKSGRVVCESQPAFCALASPHVLTVGRVARRTPREIMLFPGVLRSETANAPPPTVATPVLSTVSCRQRRVRFAPMRFWGTPW